MGRGVKELGQAFVEVKLHGSGGAAAVFADHNVGDIGRFRIFVVEFVSVNKHDNIRVLLKTSRFT